MRFLKLLQLLRVLATLRKRLLDLPDLADSEDTEAWLAAVLDSGDALADLTATDIDDKFVDALQNIVDDDEAWATIHGIIVAILGLDDDDDDDDDHIVFSEDQVEQMDSVGARLGLNPALIAMIVKAAIAFLKWLRDRRA